MLLANKLLAGLAVATVISASDYFPFDYPSDCITSCSLEAGKKCWSEYTQDEANPNFVQSFSCLCDTSNPGNGAFMGNSLKCLIKNRCSGKDIGASMALQGPICKWYNQHKNDPKPTETLASTMNSETTETQQSTVSSKTTQKSTVTSETQVPTITSETTKTHESTTTSKTTETQNSTITSETSKTQESTITSENTDTQKTTSKATETPETTITSKTTETPEPTINSKTTEAQKSTITAETTKNQESTATSKSTKTQEPTVTSEPTKTSESTKPTETHKPTDYFPFEYPSECITSCSLKAGKQCWSSYTQDETDPNFVQSFSCLCDTKNPGNGAFMANSLQCLTASKCDGKDIMASMELQGPICEWYNQHKNDLKPTAKPESTVATESQRSTETPKPTKSQESISTSETVKPTETTETAKPTETHKPSDYFPFEYPSECITSCSLKAGKQCWSSYTQDETDPNFVQSFSCLCDTKNPGNGAFMANSLQCLTASKCDGKDIMASMALQGPICEWYNQHKNDPKPTGKPESTVATESQRSTETPKPTGSQESTSASETPKPTQTTEATKPTETHKPSDYFPFEYPSECITSCSLKAGKQCWSSYTQDETDPNFVQSFSCLCDTNNPGNGAFMANSLQCLTASKCDGKDIMASMELQGPICEWYNQHKNDPKPTGKPESTVPTESQKSTETQKPTETQGSTITSKTAVTTKPTETQETSKATQLSISTESTLTTATGSSNVPTKSSGGNSSVSTWSATTQSCVPSTITVTSTVTVSPSVPKPTETSCEHGVYKCIDSGKSPKFTSCAYGRPMEVTCAVGTVCKTIGSSIVCDWA